MRRNAHSRSIMALLCGLFLFGGTPAHTEPPFTSSLPGNPACRASGFPLTVCRPSTPRVRSHSQGTASSRVPAPRTSPPTKPGQVGRTYGHPVLNDQGVIAFWRSQQELVFGTPSQRFVIPASLSPPFPPNSGFVGYDLARTAFTTTGAFSTSSDPNITNTFNWTVGTFPTPGIVSFVASGQGTPFQPGHRRSTTGATPLSTAKAPRPRAW